ncbi:hypothetical protein [Legionella fairfieldensis]|uniref:hypothetical protein n=1 Tax=Legionella fairfieldensis TaxID=45064 RepID=UPI00048F4D1F|nr:hypothetical protein [Legionella fairfieldensis]
MNSTDLTQMIGNLSRSLFPIQHLLSGLAYLMGIVFFMIALSKLKKIGGAGGHSQEKIFVPLAYFIGGSALLFMPSAFSALTNTAFGVGNILQYANYNPYDIYNSMGLIIQTAGVLWFIRGCVLLVHASEPGVQHGPKGLAFLCAGVLAMNFENTASFLNYVLEQLTSLTLTVKNMQGY